MKEKEITVSGKTVEEAIQEALKALKLSKEKAEIEVLEEPKKGWLGLIGGKPAMVRVIEKKINPIEQTVEYLRSILKKMGILVEIEVVEQTNRDFIFQLSGEKIALAIGKRGQTLNALQTMINLYANQLAEHVFRIIIDAENYRSRRESSLKGLANRMAAKVVTTKRAVQLEPMPSYERKIIHSVLQNSQEVKTVSVGEDPHRSVKIELK